MQENIRHFKTHVHNVLSPINCVKIYNLPEAHAEYPVQSTAHMQNILSNLQLIQKYVFKLVRNGL